VPPRTPAEQALAAIWSEVLGVERVGVDDNFFDLGGHSLLAMQVVSRAREFFGVEVPLAKLFDHPTLAGQAHAFMESQAQEPELAPAPGPTIQRRSKSIDRQLAELDRLSEDEVKSLLQTEMQLARENI
jgi:acyl carrier protein